MINSSLSQRQYLIQLLGWTLDPQLTKHATGELELMRSRRGFMRELVMICVDSVGIQFLIRFSAIVYLKNMIEQYTKGQLQSSSFVNYHNENKIDYDHHYPHQQSTNDSIYLQQDYEYVKSVLIQVTIKLIEQNDNKLVLIMKQICFVMVKYQYTSGSNLSSSNNISSNNNYKNKKSNIITNTSWDTFITTKLITCINNCANEPSVRCVLIITKIIFYILGKSLTQQKRLNIVSNQLMLPLIGLGQKMFMSIQDQFSCLELINVFRVFTQAIEYHLPEVMCKNIDIFMSLVGRVLGCDANVLSSNGMNSSNSKNLQRTINIIRLKKQALTFLQKFYQRHATSNLLTLKSFVKQFNNKYTKGYFQIIVKIIMENNHIINNNDHNNDNKLINANSNNNNNKFHHNHNKQPKINNMTYSLKNHALGIFSFIVSNRQSSKYIKQQVDNCQINILYLTIERYLQSNEANKYQTALSRNKMLSKRRRSKINNNNTHSHTFSNSLLSPPQQAANEQQIKLYLNYADFLQTISQQRLHLRLYISTIFSNKKHNNKKNNNKNKIIQILKLLVQCIINGSYKEKQLGMYLLGSLEKEIEVLSEDYCQGEGGFNINQRMVFILCNYVYPLLKQQSLIMVTQYPQQQQHLHNQQQKQNTKNITINNHHLTLIKLRGYQLYFRFQYLPLPKQHCIQLCQQIYHQLSLPTTTQQQLFLKIQCIQTFNLILTKHQQLIPLLAPNIMNILRIYTELLLKEYQVMRSYDQILDLFNMYIVTDGKIVKEVLGLLVGVYFQLVDRKMLKYNGIYQMDMNFNVNNNNNNNTDNINNKEQQQQDDSISDTQTVYDPKQQDKFDSVGIQCISTIKKLLYKSHHILTTTINKDQQLYNQTHHCNQDNITVLADKLMLMALNALIMRDQGFVAQGLRVINMLLYNGMVTKYYSMVFVLFLYPSLLSQRNNTKTNTNKILQKSIQNYLSQQKPQYNNNLYTQTKIANKINNPQCYEQLYSQYFTQLLRQIYYCSNKNNNCEQELFENVLEFRDTIGCIKNSIKYFSWDVNNKDSLNNNNNKSIIRLSQLYCPITGLRCISMLLTIIKSVMSSLSSSQKYNKKDVIGVLQILFAMIDNRVFDYSDDNNSVDNHTTYLKQDRSIYNNNSTRLDIVIENVFGWLLFKDRYDILDGNQHNNENSKLEQFQQQSFNNDSQSSSSSDQMNNVGDSKQKQSVCLLRLIMMLCCYYPQQVFTYMQQHQQKHSIIMVNQYNQQISQFNSGHTIITNNNNNVTNLINFSIIQKIELYFKVIQTKLKLFNKVNKQNTLKQQQQQCQLQEQQQQPLFSSSSQSSQQQGNQALYSQYVMELYVMVKGLARLSYVIKGRWNNNINNKNTNNPNVNNQLSSSLMNILSKLQLLILKGSVYLCYLSIKLVVIVQKQQSNKQFTHEQLSSMKNILKSIQQIKLGGDNYKHNSMMKGMQIDYGEQNNNNTCGYINKQCCNKILSQIDQFITHLQHSHYLNQTINKNNNHYQHYPINNNRQNQHHNLSSSSLNNLNPFQNHYRNTDQLYLQAYQSNVFNILEQQNNKVKLINVIKEIVSINKYAHYYQ